MYNYNPVKLPDNGTYIQFNDNVILFLPETTIEYNPVTDIMWSNYSMYIENTINNDIWEVAQTKDNKAYLRTGPCNYKLISTAIINNSKFKEKILNEVFWIGMIEFKVVSYDEKILIAEGVERGYKIEQYE